MFIIFGWGHQTQNNYGPTLPIRCPHCNNDTFWHLVNTKVWFTLFFIPVIPYESIHYLLCDVCGRGIRLDGKQEIEEARYLNQATLSFLNKGMTESLYATVLDETRMLGN